MNLYMIKEHVIDEVPRDILGMSTSIMDLPTDSTPYGFWVDRSGNFLEVESYSHDVGVSKIVSRTKNYMDEKGIRYMPKYNYKELLGIGWCRVVISSVYVMYQMGEGYTLTTSQSKFLKILEENYEKEGVVRDR